MFWQLLRKRMTCLSPHFFQLLVLMRKITSQLGQIVPCPLLPKIIDEVRTVAGWICSAGVECNSQPIVLESDCPPRETELEGHAHTRRSASTHRTVKQKEMTTPKCPLCSGPMMRRQHRVNKGSSWGCQQWPTCNGTRRPWERGKDETSRA